MDDMITLVKHFFLLKSVLVAFNSQNKIKRLIKVESVFNQSSWVSFRCNIFTIIFYVYIVLV